MYHNVIIDSISEHLTAATPPDDPIPQISLRDIAATFGDLNADIDEIATSAGSLTIRDDDYQ